MLLAPGLWACSHWWGDPASLRLWYSQPADASAPDSPNGWQDDPEWLKALPLGNGSLGIMVFGDVNLERIQLSEESMWSGSPASNDNPEAPQYLGKIRELLFEGKYREATVLTDSTQVCLGAGSGHGNGANVPFGCFQTLGDLWIRGMGESGYEDYYRELDLEDAVARVSYTRDGVNFRREIFVSHPHQVMVARFTADKPGQISFSCNMTRPERYRTYIVEDQLVMSGTLADGKGGDGLGYMVRLKAITKKGQVTCSGSTLEIQDADEAILLLAASTDHALEYPEYKGRDYKSITGKVLKAASREPYKKLLREHTRDYHWYFSRVRINLAGNKPDTIPTDRRINQFREKGPDSRLYELVFQFGRYLLISSSRPGTLPANLQGIWTNKIQTPWNGDYHTDVNLEMNYWPAEVTNLPEMHLPLFDLIASLVEPGSRTARVQYGADGWVVHPITNVWGYTSPGENASWGMHTGAAAWICQHIGEHFRFTGDTALLARMYPVLEGAVAFYLDWLVEHPLTGRLVSGPAVSPENTFIAPDGSRCQISMGPTHDQQVIRQLFDDFVMFADILEKNGEMVEEVIHARDRLECSRVGSDGRIMEWAGEFPEAEPGHRHISHLFAVHPGSLINPLQTPELAKAAVQSLDFRLSYGGGHTGWSAAWLISLYARLHEPERAGESLDLVLEKSIHPNLFGSCPPFQADNNFGTTAGIAEMLLQSHVQDREGRYLVHLLPALPGRWESGSVRGLKARGGLTVDIFWSDGMLKKAVIQVPSEQEFIVRYRDKQKIINAPGRRVVNLDGNSL